MMKALYKEEGASLRIEILENPDVLDFIGEHAGILDSAFGTAKLSDTMRRSLEDSDWMFSGFKAFHEMNEAFPSLLDEKGGRKPFERFLNDVLSIDNTYNRNYLNAEYNFAQASAEMAGRWESFDHGDDRYLLEYRTAGDDKVRPEHAAMNGIALPESDRFWDTYYPPNGWNCRCTVVQVRRKGRTPSNSEEAMRRGAACIGEKGKMFAFNPGKQQKVFPDYNPYTISRCSSCPKASLKLAANLTDNQVCQACSQIHKQYDVTSALLSLHNKTGREYVETLREISKMKIFKPVKGIDGIFSAISESAKDYRNLLEGAKKMSSHGYTVYVLPNPTTTKSGDYILTKKRFAGLYDLKTISGESSARNRLMESKNQAKRVILNISSNYNPRRLAVDIMSYYNSNNEAEEVIVLKGGRMFTATRSNVKAKKWAKQFYEDYTKKK